MCQNYESWLAVDKVIAIIINSLPLFLGHPVYYVTVTVHMPNIIRLKTATVRSSTKDEEMLFNLPRIYKRLWKKYDRMWRAVLLITRYMFKRTRSLSNLDRLRVQCLSKK